MVVRNKKISKSGTWDYFKIWELVKGQKKPAIALVAMLLTGLISDSSTVTTISTAVISIVWALVEFRVKNVEITQ